MKRLITEKEKLIFKSVLNNLRQRMLFILIVLFSFVSCDILTSNYPPEEVAPPVALEVIEVGFKGDHLLTKWPDPTDRIDDPDGSEPTWRKDQNPDHPVAYTMSKQSTLFATIKITPPLPSPGIIASIRAKLNGVEITKLDGIQLVGDRVTVHGFKTQNPLENTVRKTEHNFDWESNHTGTWASIGTSGPHRMFFVFHTPVQTPFANGRGKTWDPLYDSGVEKACGYADGETDHDTVLKSITSGIGGDIIYNPGNGMPLAFHPLNLYNFGEGMCWNHANLCRGLFRSIGLEGTLIFAWAGNAVTIRFYRFAFNFVSFMTKAPLTDAAPQNPHFTYHAFVYNSGKDYDPSYGIVHSPIFTVDETFNGTPLFRSNWYYKDRGVFMDANMWLCNH